MRRAILGGAVVILAAIPAIALARGETRYTGTEPQKIPIEITKNSPVVFTYSFTGTDSNIVTFNGGPGFGGIHEKLFNRVDTFRGQTLLPDVPARTYELFVDATGSWAIDVSQPAPGAGARPLRGTFTGRGGRVIPVRALRPSKLLFSAVTKGDDNITVWLISFGPNAAKRRKSIFSGFGNFNGQKRLAAPLPAGPYLLWIETHTNTWTVKVS